MKKIIWAAEKVFFFAILYFALFENIKWCQNLTSFLIITNLILLILLCFTGPEGLKRIRANRVKIPISLHVILNCLFMCSLASFGWFFLAGISFISMLLSTFIYYGEEHE